MATITKKSKAESMAELDEHTANVKQFKTAVSNLFDTVQEWCGKRNWTTTRNSEVIMPLWDKTRPAREAYAYDIDTLTVDTDLGQVNFQPVGYDIAGAKGRVDFSAYPSLYRVRLLLTGDDQWTVRTDSGIDWPNPWGEKTFEEITLALLRAR